MKKTLTVYFSASGVTARAAQAVAEAAGSDIFEIEPAVPYTQADLNWMDKKSRSTVEMNDPTCRPEIASRVDDMDSYDTIFLGFPIWWYREPSIIDTFLESYDFTGKKIVLFATSGGSGFGKTAHGLKKLAPGADIVEGRLLNGRPGSAVLKEWISGII